MRSPRAAALAAMLSLAAVSRPALAQVDSSTRGAARILAEAGLALEGSGDYAGALVKYERALTLVEVPTLAVLTAGCLVRLGRFVEAAERYRQARVMPVDPALPAGYRAQQLEAQAQAEVARAGLTARIPILEIVLEGAAPADVELRIDDRIVPAAAIGVERPIDPGQHRIEVRRGPDTATGATTLGEGQHERVVLKLPPRAAGAGPLAPPPDPRAGATQRAAGGVAAGLGGAGVVVGVITWVLALGKKAELDTACPGQICHGTPPALDTYDTLRTATIAAMVSGGALLGAGLVTVAVALRPSPGDRRAGAALTVSPWMGPGAAGGAGVSPILTGVRGSF